MLDCMDEEGAGVAAVAEEAGMAEEGCSSWPMTKLDLSDGEGDLSASFFLALQAAALSRHDAQFRTDRLPEAVRKW